MCSSVSSALSVSSLVRDVYLRGWRYGEMITALAEKERCPLYEAWQRLMQTRFHVREAENRQVVDLSKDHEVIDLTGED